MPPHDHGTTYSGAAAVNNGSQVGVKLDGATNTGMRGGGSPHNNLQPFSSANFLIKT